MSEMSCAFDFPIIPEEVPFFSAGSKPLGFQYEADKLADALLAEGICGEGLYLAGWLQAEREGLEQENLH
jgi:hypothetical protein